MDKDKNASREYSSSCEQFTSSRGPRSDPLLLSLYTTLLTVTFEEFQEGSKADPTIISALTLVSEIYTAFCLELVSLPPLSALPSALVIVRWPCLIASHACRIFKLPGGLGLWHLSPAAFSLPLNPCRYVRSLPPLACERPQSTTCSLISFDVPLCGVHKYKNLSLFYYKSCEVGCPVQRRQALICGLGAELGRLEGGGDLLAFRRISI